MHQQQDTDGSEQEEEGKEVELDVFTSSDPGQNNEKSISEDIPDEPNDPEAKEISSSEDDEYLTEQEEDEERDEEKNPEDIGGNLGENVEEIKKGIAYWIWALSGEPLVRYGRNFLPAASELDYGFECNPIKYIKKWKGKSFRGSAPVPLNIVHIFFSWIASFVGIWVLAILHFEYFLGEDLIFLIGSFGASAVLAYAAPTSPLAQPRNLVGGHLVSAVVGVLCYYYFPDHPLKATPCAAAVSLAIVAMHLTGTLHPPGAATALIAAIGGPGIERTGWLYIPLVFMGAIIMVIVALLMNNVPKVQQYPIYWW